MDAPSQPTPSTPAEPRWVALRDEELLAMRVCDLGLRIEGSELEPRIAQLHEELAARGIALHPPCYLGDEWFTPSEQAIVAIPFWLAHPRLKALELRQVLEVEGGTHEQCMQLLRHECGHALDHAYRFSRRRRWRALFGDTDNDATPDIYRPRPYSKSFVRHLANWYAQAHPDEDFAETFAVWLGVPEREWRAKYRGWKALEKLEYVDELMREAAKMRRPSGRVPARKIADASRMRKTLARYYAERRKKYAEDYPDVYDIDLRAIFGGEPSEESAAHFLRKARKTIVPSIVRWTGEHKYTVDHLVRRLTMRCERLALVAPQNQTRLVMDVSAYVAALVTNHLHTGRFKRFV
ncbi:MAG: putative zinc-binding metallopeptidase [Myxococcales bacterium]|nr:putative zinc-binding metallopeptidase [Myxococcales bacterium]